LIATRVSRSAKRHLRSGNFNALVTLLKQNISKGIRMARYLTHTCPRCKHFLGVVVREPSVGRTARSVRGFCLHCRYQLNWKLIPGRLLQTSTRRPVRQRPQRSVYPHDSEVPPSPISSFRQNKRQSRNESPFNPAHLDRKP
jgi:hypothetical protein